jgi:hypothetical protein
MISDQQLKRLVSQRFKAGNSSMMQNIVRWGFQRHFL